MRSLLAIVLFLVSMAAYAQPNVVLIITDDAGYHDFGFQGSLDIPTPRIDDLANRGVVFSTAYTTAAVCSPSRAAIITGRYQQRFGHEFNLEVLDLDGDWGLPAGESTLAGLLRARGYATTAIGKWHLGVKHENHPMTRGFDSFYGFLGSKRDYFAMENPRRTEALLEGKHKTDEPTYTSDDFTTRAIEYIGENSHQPFFVYLAYNAVHNPMQAKDEHQEMFSNIPDELRRTLAGMTYSIDENIGRIIDKLMQEGVYGNTMVVFINDNGGPTDTASDNTPLRGSKGNQFEGGIRVPFLIKMPYGIGSNTVYEYPVSALDILPTILAFTGTVPENLDGVNLTPYVRGNKVTGPHQALFWRRGSKASVRKGPWKLIRWTDRIQLYNVAMDISETTDMSETRPDKAVELLALLEAWEDQL